MKRGDDTTTRRRRGSVAVKYSRHLVGVREREGGGGGRVATIEGRGLVVVVRVRGTVRAPVDLRATVESLTGYHHRTTAEPWFTGRGQSGTRLFASSKEPKIFLNYRY